MGSLSVTSLDGATITGSFATKPCGVNVFYQCTGYPVFPATPYCL